MLSSSELKKLNSIFTEYPGIEAVYLFGSAASNKKVKTIDTDIDLGIVSSDSSIESKTTDLYADMIRNGLDTIDIVFFNTVDLVLQFQIIHLNKLIYRKEGFNHGELFSKTIRKYFDFKPYLDRQRKILKERIANG